MALPDAFFAVDGLFETFLTVLDDFGAYPAVARARAGPLPAVPRDDEGADGRRAQRCRPRAAHEAIKEHAVAVALGDARVRAATATTCSTGWPRDPRLGLSRAQLDALVDDPLSFTGAAETILN